jgi:ketosteroid isomerase-like protein
LIEESVDVARSGDMALYRGLYNQDSVNDGVPMTHKTRFIAEFRRQAAGGWKMPWYVVSPTERSHKK